MFHYANHLIHQYVPLKKPVSTQYNSLLFRGGALYIYHVQAMLQCIRTWSPRYRATHACIGKQQFHTTCSTHIHIHFGPWIFGRPSNVTLSSFILPMLTCTHIYMQCTQARTRMHTFASFVITCVYRSHFNYSKM